MSQTNGTTHDRSLTERLEEAEARVRLARAEAELSLLESSYQPYPQPIFPTDFQGLRYDSSGRAWLPIGTAGRHARKDGDNRSVIQGYSDLERMWERARYLYDTNPIAQGALDCLTDYAIGTGFQYQAEPTKGLQDNATAKELARLVQQCVDEFRDLNQMAAVEREWFLRSRRDGDLFARHFAQNDGTTLVREVEPEQVRQPQELSPEWSWGIHVERDVVTPRAYAVTYGEQDDLEEIPASEMSHLKCNVDRNVKRGLSDFFSTSTILESAAKLLYNMQTVGNVQAALPWIEQYENATQSALDALTQKRRDLNTPNFIDPITGREKKYEHFEAGRIPKVGGGRNYIPQPSAENVPNHIALLQASYRAVGTRWSEPEYMISGDSSNANYSSTLISGSPFVKRVQCLQRLQYQPLFLRTHWIAIRNAAQAGRFQVGARVFTADEIQRYVDLQVTPPQVEIKDHGKDSLVDMQDLKNKVMSKQERRRRLGLDSDQMRREIAEEPIETAPEPGQGARL